MKSATPKVMHKVAGLPILGHVIAAARGAGVERIVVVTSPDGAMVRDFAKAEGAEEIGRGVDERAVEVEDQGWGHIRSLTILCWQSAI